MSRETDHILAAATSGGVYARVTPGGYWRPSSDGWHGKYGTVGADGTAHSLALDLAGRTPGRGTPALLAIFNALYNHRFKLRELYYSGPGAEFNVYRGRVTAINLVPQSIRADHLDHVHCAVVKGMFLPVTPKVPSTTQEASVTIGKPAVAIRHNPLGEGYWIFAADGGVFAYGVQFYGSAGSLPLQAPIVDAEVTHDGGGYWLLGADGGVFAYGNASYKGNAKEHIR